MLCHSLVEIDGKKYNETNKEANKPASSGMAGRQIGHTLETVSVGTRQQLRGPEVLQADCACQVRCRFRRHFWFLVSACFLEDVQSTEETSHTK